MTDCVRITDVSPRDGLQNEPGFVPTEQKAELICTLGQAGLDEIEITSFVSPKWVPQLGDATALCTLLAQKPESKPEGVRYSALVPNEQGIQALLKANEQAGFRLIDKVSVFTAASEQFSQKNTNASIAQTIERFEAVIQLAREHGLRTRGYISCIVACPFEGPIKPIAVAAVACRLADIGIDEIDLGDTIGAATPETIGRVISTTLQSLDETHNWTDASRITLHLHDTTGQAAACVRTALGLGVRSFDSSAGGLGGCPYASCDGTRAPGNIATQTLCQSIEDAGFSHRVDRVKLRSAASLAQRFAAHAQG